MQLFELQLLKFVKCCSYKSQTYHYESFHVLIATKISKSSFALKNPGNARCFNYRKNMKYNGKHVNAF